METLRVWTEEWGAWFEGRFEEYIDEGLAAGLPELVMWLPLLPCLVGIWCGALPKRQILASGIAGAVGYALFDLLLLSEFHPQGAWGALAVTAGGTATLVLFVWIGWRFYRHLIPIGMGLCYLAIWQLGFGSPTLALAVALTVLLLLSVKGDFWLPLLTAPAAAWGAVGLLLADGPLSIGLPPSLTRTGIALFVTLLLGAWGIAIQRRWERSKTLL